MTRELSPILSKQERTTLEYCEKIIRQSTKVFMEAGRCLRLIRDRRLYRTDYGTFEQYVYEVWGMARGSAYRAISVYECAAQLEDVTTTTERPSARCYRPLLTVKDKRTRQDAWRSACIKAEREGVQVTEKRVADEVARFTKKHKKEPEQLTIVDQTGTAVPEKLVKAFEARAARLGRKAAQVALKAAKNLPVAVGRREEALRLAEELDQIFEDALPYAVCPSCFGEGCGWCGNTGWMRKHILEDYQRKMEE